MANIQPFQPYRYTSRGGPIEHLVTQPYDKISPEMQERYLAASPHNLVRIILGERFPDDHAADNPYTRAQALLNGWIRDGVLAQDPEPAFYVYFQEFQLPDSSETLVRKSFIGLGPVEDYAARIVHRHEQTLSGPKKDRMQLLEHTRAHFGQIFMLYPDPELSVDKYLDEAAGQDPLIKVQDEYGTCHSVWKLTDAGRIEDIQDAMREKKLLIADGHHRYETALAFRHAHSEIPGAARVMMTFVNMHSPGVRILATHRVVRGVSGFDRASFLAKAGARALGSLSDLRALFAAAAPDRLRMGIVAAEDERVYAIDRPRAPNELDVAFLHRELLERGLGISEEAVREERNLHYVRGLENAAREVSAGDAQLAFLLEPTTITQVADVAFGGGVMPQKSTDFFPKLLSGLTIYRL